MKTILALLFALCAFAQSASAQTIVEGKPVAFKFEYDGLYPARIYRDGIQLKEFTLSEITATTNTVNGVAVYTYKVTVPSLPRGRQSITATIVYDGVESEHSAALLVGVKPKAPWSFGIQ